MLAAPRALGGMKWILILTVMYQPLGVVVVGRSVTIDHVGLVDHYVSRSYVTKRRCQNIEKKLLANLQTRVALGRLSNLHVQSKCVQLNDHGDLQAR